MSEPTKRQAVIHTLTGAGLQFRQAKAIVAVIELMIQESVERIRFNPSLENNLMEQQVLVRQLQKPFFSRHFYAFIVLIVITAIVAYAIKNYL